MAKPLAPRARQTACTRAIKLCSLARARALAKSVSALYSWAISGPFPLLVRANGADVRKLAQSIEHEPGILSSISKFRECGRYIEHGSCNSPLNEFVLLLEQYFL